MKYYEKIKRIRIKRGFSVRDVTKRSEAIFGKGSGKGVSKSTINRIEAGQPHKFSSLLQLCFLLGISLKEICLDTEFEEMLVLRKKYKTGGYIFDEKVSSKFINNPNQNFSAQEYTLKTSGKTNLDYASKDKGKSDLLIYVVMGEVHCHVEDKLEILKYGDSLSLDGTKPHYFENLSKTECRFIVVENPCRY